jgi:hypothetical protein
MHSDTTCAGASAFRECSGRTATGKTGSRFEHQFSHCLAFDLADPFARDVEPFA